MRKRRSVSSHEDAIAGWAWGKELIQGMGSVGRERKREKKVREKKVTGKEKGKKKDYLAGWEWGKKK